jgi:hypothetical protein
MRSALLLAFGAAVIVAIGAGFALANGGGNTYTGCLTMGGAINNVAIGEDPARPCRDDQTEISWSEEGPPGADGQDGADGADGTVAPVYQVTAFKGRLSLGDAVANNKFVDAKCNANDQLISGGIELVGTTGGGTVTAAPTQELADHLTILESRPLGGDGIGGTWRGRAHETPENGLTNAQGWEIRVTAMCMDLTP